MKIKITFLLGAICVALATSLFAQNSSLTSPDGNITLEINTSDKLSWSVTYKGEKVIENVDISMTINETTVLGDNLKVLRKSNSSVNQEIKPVVPNKDAIIQDKYNELSIRFRGNYSVNFRAYNEGVGYQFVTNMKGNIEVTTELMDVQFPEKTTSYFPLEETMYSHYERAYITTQLDTLSEKAFCSLPVLFDTKQEVKIFFSEADLHDYPGMFLEGNRDNSLHSIFPKHVLEAVPASDRDMTITKEADYIAKTVGKRSFPWRVFIISDDDKDFVESNLIYQFSSTIKSSDDYSWLKPGRVAWDWYNANNIYGVDFKSGINNDTYKYYIDFASKYGIEYVILDEGWTKSTTEILDSNPDIDIPDLIAYANERNVDLILWVLWKPLDDNMEEILDKYQKWGAKGVKVDFMQRADQYMVNSYEEIARQCALRKMMVDFHGAFKPAGLRRTYPNVISYEGVKGNENNKWSADVSPEHNVTLPFIRMAAGPMDFTPGAVRNATQSNHEINFNRPVSLGTRCHQAAMYVVYESPLQMYCDAPSAYLKEEETISFVSQIPSVWDETIVLDAAVADYISVARRKETKWFVGAMTDWTERELEIDFSFLPSGEWQLELMKDGVNADKFAEDYKKEIITINNQTKHKIQLAPGGGWAGIITKK